jgi:hypothetical protein
MIVALHVATGAATGVLTRSRAAAIVLGPVLHVASDHVPHRHPRHDALDYATGLAAVGLLVRRRGTLDAATIGALAAVAPDFEHLLTRRRSRKLFHRRPGADRKDRRGLSTATQLGLAALLLAPLLVRHQPAPAPSEP